MTFLPSNATGPTEEQSQGESPVKKTGAGWTGRRSLFRWAGLGLLLTIIVAFSINKVPTLVHGQGPDCGKSLQSMIDEARPGSTLRVPGCIYREDINVNKSLTIIGSPGTEIRGSDVWSDWQPAGAFWRSNQILEAGEGIPDAEHFCPDRNPECLYYEQVFFDEAKLTHVAANPKHGQFAIGSDRHILLGDNPSGHVVEVSMRGWMYASADNVTIQNFTMRHSPGEGIFIGYKTGWVLRDSVFRDAHILNIHPGPDTKTINNEIAYGGQLGMFGSGLIQGNRFHDNNVSGFDTAWQAGAIKTVGKGVTIDGNEVDHNHGVGIWFDIDSSNILIQNNRVHDNENIGIHYEISHDGKILNNICWHNAGPGILLSQSPNTEVANNIVAWNDEGIKVQAYGGAPPNTVSGDSVHDNMVFGYKTDKGAETLGMNWEPNGTGPFKRDANKASHNGYWYADPEGDSTRFIWNGDYSRLMDFNGTPVGGSDYYLSEEQKNQALTTAQVPLTPGGPAPANPTAQPTPDGRAIPKHPSPSKASPAKASPSKSSPAKASPAKSSPSKGAKNG